ncbi:MAG: M48 family metalloprotease [Brachymonas sp.]|nr:M48 family metalloprotease [Brachymonas sp.]
MTTLVAATLLGCGSKTVNPVTGQQERSVMSEQQEVQIGAQGHAEIMKEYTALANPRLQAYVNEIGQRLAKLSHRSNLKWTFTVLDSPEINAFAIPGGYVYITRGIMAYLDSEADLAGVIGHEIGHVTARHGAQRATRQQDAALVGLLGGVLGAVLDAKGGGGIGQQIGEASQAAAAGYVAKYGREQELQADGLGAEYLSRVNYDPRNMIDVIRVLKDQERFAQEVARAEGRPAPQAGNSWLASHPSNDQRLEQINRIAAQYQGNKNYADEGRLRYLQMIDGMPFGESPEQGLTRGRNFYHSSLNFAMTAANGWRIVNEASELNIVSPAGDAALIVQLAPPNAGRTHDEVIRNVVKPTSGRVERYNLGGGIAATHFTGAIAAQGGQRGIELTVATGAGGQQFIMVYAAKDATTLQRNRAALRETENSFRAMTAQDTAAAKPWVLRMSALPRGGFAELATRLPLATLPEQQLKLINGVYSGGNVAAGALVKTVVQ